MILYIYIYIYIYIYTFSFSPVIVLLKNIERDDEGCTIGRDLGKW